MSIAAPFGTMLTAMVTPFTDDGDVDYDGAARLASHLVDHGHDGLVINGTTGESATTSDAEKVQLLSVVIEAVGDRAVVVAGAGTNDTRHSVHLAAQAAAAGADGLLAVTPYYNKPPQEGLIRHFTAIADSTDLPVLLYDIPSRSVIPIEVETLVRLAEHPRIVAVKDAKGDLGAATWAMRRTNLAWYSGDDVNNLALLSIGGVGFVSVVGHLVGPELAAMAAAYKSGEVARATAIHQQLMPVFTGIFRTQGVILTKAALNQLGLPAGPVRLPLVDATPEQVIQLRADLGAAGVTGFSA
ncbi:MAG: 4-hydroxy-tetrahydrodipicolinate synthase [Actinomycetes bacterium]